MDTTREIAAVVIRCRNALDWANLDTYSRYETYPSLPLIVLDAVFSINAKYDQVVKPLIQRYCDYFQKGFGVDPSISEQSVDQFVKIGRDITAECLAAEVLKNSQRTSTRGGILKTDAAIRFAEILLDFGVHQQADVDRVKDSDRFCRWIRTIPGQDISLDYFLMMIGRDDLVKADRRVLAFLQDCLGHPVVTSDAFRLLAKTTAELKRDYEHLTPRVLDHMIWKYMDPQKPVA